MERNTDNEDQNSKVHDEKENKEEKSDSFRGTIGSVTTETYSTTVVFSNPTPESGNSNDNNKETAEKETDSEKEISTNLVETFVKVKEDTIEKDSILEKKTKKGSSEDCKTLMLKEIPFSLKRFRNFPTNSASASFAEYFPPAPVYFVNTIP